MRWLITLFLGMALGAGALFTDLRWYGESAPAPATVVSPVAVQPSPPPLQPSPPPAEPAPPPPADGQTVPAPDGQPQIAPNQGEPAGAQPNSDPHTPTGQTGSTAPAGKLLLPVDGIKTGQLSDTFNQPRGAERRHEALDIMAPKGAKVFAVADGKIAKLFNSKPGGLTVYEFDPSEKFSYYYAHLDRYAEGLQEGQQVKRGDLLGYVGVSGNADPNAPHLHFAVFELPPTREWWKGKPVNPYPLLRD